MRSHSYPFTLSEWVRIVAMPMLGVLLLSGLLHAANGLRLLPEPRPLDDPDQTLLLSKFQMSRSRHPARVILAGDSSCAAGVDALALASELPGHPPVLNLGLIIGLGLEIYGEALEDFLKANPGQVELVVLLVTPQLLTQQDLSPVHQQFWRELRRGRTKGADSESSHALAVLLGTGLVRDRLLPRFLNVPLKGQAAAFYGFTADFQKFLARHNGSMVDPRNYRAPHRADLARYELASRLEGPSRGFREHLNPEVKLAVGLTPLPRGLVSKDYSAERDELLRQWNQWLRADYLLTNVPAHLPDGLFATGGHLNEQGQSRFTHLLAEALQAFPNAPYKF